MAAAAAAQPAQQDGYESAESGADARTSQRPYDGNLPTDDLQYEFPFADEDYFKYIIEKVYRPREMEEVWKVYAAAFSDAIEKRYRARLTPVLATDQPMFDASVTEPMIAAEHHVDLQTWLFYVKNGVYQKLTPICDTAATHLSIVSRKGRTHVARDLLLYYADPYFQIASNYLAHTARSLALSHEEVTRLRGELRANRTNEELAHDELQALVFFNLGYVKGLHHLAHPGGTRLTVSSEVAGWAEIAINNLARLGDRPLPGISWDAFP